MEIEIIATYRRLARFPLIGLDRVRRFADRARLPMKPVWDIVRETAERTGEVWKGLPHKELLPASILRTIDGHIAKAIARTQQQ